MAEMTPKQMHDLIMLRAELRARYLPQSALQPGGFHDARVTDQHIICEIDGMRTAAEFLLEDHDTHVPELSIPTWTIPEYEARRDKILNKSEEKE